MDVNAAVAAAAALAGLCTGVIAALAFRWSERELKRPTRTSLHTEAVLPPGVDTVLSVLSSSAVVLDEEDNVVKASSAAYALGLVRGGRLAVEPMLKLARETRRDGEIRQTELDLPRRTGRGGPLAVSARVAPLGSRLVLLLVEDLTRARRIEAVRRDFVANVSHELKTPVGALQKEATRLTTLVQELIDLSRVQNDDPLEDAEPVLVRDLVAEAVDRCRQTAGAKHITIVPGGMGEDLSVWGNRGQLAAALGNLVENAVNYSPEHTRVGIAARRNPAGGGDLVELAVTDQGIGISEKDRERVFERFYRVDPARSRMTGGTGIGLAIVKHVAASHGGEVTVWSTEGEGSTFTLRLPEAGTARTFGSPGDTSRTTPRTARGATRAATRRTQRGGNGGGTGQGEAPRTRTTTPDHPAPRASRARGAAPSASTGTSDETASFEPLPAPEVLP
ncbi:cell wall metabolism sensor histidine kinase WalK [Streptomyces sp. NEAU-H3]|uniref:sensor histidine kinase n=1 Tax=Streptomyces sp. NEAU-H3 TaxID=2720636 RepID=UPI001439DE1B|nr:ATP-binding protein [Streptomyces sp. NEAU-H3]NJA58902.1 two-component sensor histidine kinase [Streptomyces sp. NEAU-H3]